MPRKVKIIRMIIQYKKGIQSRLPPHDPIWKRKLYEFLNILLSYKIYGSPKIKHSNRIPSIHRFPIYYPYLNPQYQYIHTPKANPSRSICPINMMILFVSLNANRLMGYRISCKRSYMHVLVRSISKTILQSKKVTVIGKMKKNLAIQPSLVMNLLKFLNGLLWYIQIFNACMLGLTHQQLFTLQSFQIYSNQTNIRDKMEVINKCKIHNLPEEIICIGEFCTKRIGCELCVARHDHKFYLDTKNKQKKVIRVQQQVDEKLTHLKNYTKINVKSLKLDRYRQKLQRQFANQRLFLANKIKQQRANFQILMQKLHLTVTSTLQKYEKMVIDHWQAYNKQAQRHLDSQKDYQTLRQHFKSGDWKQHDHCDKSVNFLYSEELLFRFNRSLDRLKKQINHYKKENQTVTGWFYVRRNQFGKYQLCPQQTFSNLINRYNGQPEVEVYKKQFTKESRDDHQSVLQIVNSQTKALMIYPKIVYQPFQNIDKLIRYSNNIFATSGGRSISIWTRVSMNPQKSYPLDFPSYGLSTFRQYGQEDPEILIYGKSNGQLGLINVEDETVKEMDAHEGTIKDIIQFDQYHFLTASYDWTIKLWGMNHDKLQKNFASQRLKLKGSSGKVHCLCKFGPSVLSAGADNTIRLWDIMRESFDQIFTHEKEVHALAEIRNEFFASGGELKQLRVWDYRKTKAPLIKYPVQHSINSIIKYDQNTIIFNDKNIVKIIDIRNLKEPVLRLQNGSVYSHSISTIAYLSDVEIGMGGSDGYVTLWKY